MNNEILFRSRLARVIATVGGLGDHLPAPGTTAGSLPAAIVWWAVTASLASQTAMLVVSFTAVLLATVVGVWASDVE